jgi:hypothetical protein
MAPLLLWPFTGEQPISYTHLDQGNPWRPENNLFTDGVVMSAHPETKTLVIPVNA